MAIRVLQQATGLRDDDLSVRSFTARSHHPHKEHRTSIEDERTCTHCGKTGSFREAGPGGWATCNACGALA
jgi:hypothetical protein